MHILCTMQAKQRRERKSRRARKTNINCEKERDTKINLIKSIKIKQNRHQMQNISTHTRMGLNDVCIWQKCWKKCLLAHRSVHMNNKANMVVQTHAFAVFFSSSSFKKSSTSKCMQYNVNANLCRFILNSFIFLFFLHCNYKTLHASMLLN